MTSSWLFAPVKMTLQVEGGKWRGQRAGKKRGGGSHEPSRDKNEHGDLGFFHAKDDSGEHLGLVLGAQVLELVVEGVKADGDVDAAGSEHIVHAKVYLLTA